MLSYVCGWARCGCFVHRCLSSRERWIEALPSSTNLHLESLQFRPHRARCAAQLNHQAPRCIPETRSTAAKRRSALDGRRAGSLFWSRPRLPLTDWHTAGSDQESLLSTSSSQGAQEHFIPLQSFRFDCIGYYSTEPGKRSFV